MFSSLFRKRNILHTNLLRESVDIHTHLLPGVDDGVSNLMDLFPVMEVLQQNGVQRIFVTPHVMDELPGNTCEVLATRFQILKDICPAGLELKLAAEYMLDTGFRLRLKEGLLAFGNRHVLVETSYLFAPPELPDLLYEITLIGYTPVLAHPERYMYMAQNEYPVLREKGYKFQLNLFSLAGVYGKRPRQNAECLLKQGLYDYVGSDLHNIESYRNGLKRLSLSGMQEKALRLLFENNKTLW